MSKATSQTSKENLESRLDRIEKTLALALRKVEWEDKQSESGIQLAGGPTTVTRYGHIMTATILQTSPTQASIMLLIQEDVGGKFYVLAPDQVKVTG